MRVHSVDAVRGAAIVAMILAHTTAYAGDLPPKAVGLAIGVLSTTASPLFALVIGVTIAIILPLGDATPIADRWRFRGEYAMKAVLLVLLGWALDLSFSGAVVVLDYLGAAILVALPFVFLRARWLALVAGVALVAGPFINAAALAATAGDPLVRSPETGGPLGLVLDLMVFGPSYRVTGLLPMILIGVLLGRLVVGRMRRVLIVLAIGVVVAVIGVLLVKAESDAGTYRSGWIGDTLRDVGFAFTGFAAISAAIDLPWPRARRIMRALASPVTVAGLMALSVYALHILIMQGIWAGIGWNSQGIVVGTPTGIALMLAVLMACLGCAALWAFSLGVGPVERVIGVLSFRHRPRSLIMVRPFRGRDLGLG